MQQTPDRITGSHIMVRADDLRLLIPQADVKSIEHISGRPEAVDESGLMQFEGHEDSFYLAVSRQLRPLREFPSDRFLSTLLAWEGGSLRWCWNEVRVLPGLSLDVHAIPPVLLGTETPARSFVEYDGDILFPCTAERLAQFAFSEVQQ